MQTTRGPPARRPGSLRRWLSVSALWIAVLGCSARRLGGVLAACAVNLMTVEQDCPTLDLIAMNVVNRVAAGRTRRRAIWPSMGLTGSSAAPCTHGSSSPGPAPPRGAGACGAGISPLWSAGCSGEPVSSTTPRMPGVGVCRQFWRIDRTPWRVGCSCTRALTCRPFKTLRGADNIPEVLHEAVGQRSVSPERP